MRKATFLTVLSVLILSFAVSASAQRTRRPVPRATPKPTPAKGVSPIVAAAKQRVANQLYNVNIFVDKMGPIAVAIETADKDAAARRLKKEAITANEANKKKLIAAIRGLRDGLVTLETDFKTKPQLTPYNAKIQGISTLCAQSEDSAIAGRFVASKDPLRQVALKLNETLAVLPGGVAPTRAESYPPATTTTNQTRTIPVSSKSAPVSPPPSTQGNRVVPPVQTTSTAQRDVSEGMTAAEVLQSTWGAPSSKRSSTSANGTTEVWLYSGNRSIYFFNGKVTQILK